jgi:GDPmannose 4,6-dehydratase
MLKALITGVSGQDGGYLSQFLLKKNYKVIGLIREQQSSLYRLKYLGIDNKITIQSTNINDFNEVYRVIEDYRPDEIYNLAAQSSVAQSFKNPFETLNFNINSVLNILESIKMIDKKIKFYQASSSEMFGRVDRLPVSEKTPMYPLSPYAISKATAHWITINYRESFDLFTCCGILFNHESYLRGDDYFIKKVIREAFAIKNNKKNELIVGNIDIKRDFGYSPHYIEAMWLMLQQNSPDDYIICSGRSYSLRDIIYYIFDKIGVDKDKITIDKSLFRPTEIRDIFGDPTKARKKLGWSYSYDFFKILDILIEEEKKNSLNP